MFEAVEVGAKVSKRDYEEQVPQLRVDLINIQSDLLNGPFSVVVLLAGDDREGSAAVLRTLHEWMDTRLIATHALGPPNPVESSFPRFWRYWRALPPRGEIGLFYGAWAINALADRMVGGISHDEFERRIEHIRRFETALSDDGVLLLKFWLHLPAPEREKRLKRAGKKGKGWRLDERDWEIYERYDEVLPALDELLRRTDSAATPWRLVEATDRRHRDLAVGRTLLGAISQRLAEPPPPPSPPELTPPERPSVLSTVDLSARLEYDAYKDRLSDLQAELRRRARKAQAKGRAGLFLFEGWDAAGKGGVIRRLTGALDPRDYRVVSIAAPTDEELAHHYLWRFWRRLPPPGHLTVFDRSWYGRVLVERIEGLASDHEWRRAYAEINDFEAQLLEHGYVLAKFWLHIDPEEQLRRFREREKTPYKKYKITAEDYRNRDRRDAYVAAVDDMVERTSTANSPWHLVPANDKRWARVAVLEAVCAALKKAT